MSAACPHPGRRRLSTLRPGEGTVHPGQAAAGGGRELCGPGLGSGRGRGPGRSWGPGGGTPPPALHVTSAVGTCFYLFLKSLFNNARTVADLPPCRAGKHCKWGHSLLSSSPARAAVSPPELPPRSHLPVGSHRREADASGSAFHSAPSDPQTLRPPGEKPRTQQPRLPGRGPPRQPAAGRRHGSAPRGHFLCGLGVRGGPLSFPFLVPPCGVCPMPRSFSGPSNTPSHDAPPPSVRGGGVCRHLLAAGSRCCCKHLGPSCG